MSTLGLLIAAVIGGRVAFKTFRAERDRDIRSQAEHIAAWTAMYGDTFGLCLLNDSSIPVTDLTIRTSHRTTQTDDQKYNVLPPGFFFAPTHGPVNEHLGHFKRPTPAARDDLNLYPTTVEQDSANVREFFFRDASGQWWRRILRIEGEPLSLVKIPGPPPS
jgi:hypothetical protein